MSRVQAAVPFIFFTVTLLAGLAFTVFNDPYIRRGHRRVMLTVIALCLALIAQNYGENLLSAGEPRIPARTAVATLGYVIRPVIIALFFHLLGSGKRYLPVWGLVGANTLVHLTALFSPLVFWIDGENHYRRGPLSYFCLAVSLILLAYLLRVTLRESRRPPRQDAVIPVFAMLAVLCGTWLDGQVGSRPQPVTFLTVAVVVSCVLYYIWLHMQFVREHEEDLKARQRIHIMMSQIRPHFLYNTLSTIQALCSTDPEKAAGVTERFSQYLRQNLDSLGEPGLIPFWKELEHTRTYAAIEETRFRGVRVEYDIGDSDFSLPPLTLQPLVENAIRHGVRGREEGIVTVRTRREGRWHELTIRDNGTGFDVGQLAVRDSGRIGIRNVRERLESMCGGTLDIASRIGEGTEVTIRIPAGGEEARP